MAPVFWSRAWLAAAVLVAWYPLAAAAVEVSFETEQTNVRIGDRVEASVFLDAAGEDINAIAGELVFPEQEIEARGVQDGNSVVNLWIEPPRVDRGTIRFSGIVPGGYSGSRGLLFRVTFHAVREGSGTLLLRDVSALRNDGAGTAARVTSTNASLTVVGTARERGEEDADDDDTVMPEEFTPVIARDPSLFGGKYFAVFAAQDKESGIDHYEVREGDGAFVRAESPHLLGRQALDVVIAVKAVDQRGNERITVLPPQRRAQWYRSWMFWGILAVGTLGVFGGMWRLLRYGKVL